MKIILKKLQEYKNSYKCLCGTKHTLQVYDCAKQGNIKRRNGTILCRFDIDTNNINFAFAKENSPKEFEYTKYVVGLEENLEAIQKIPHHNAEELYHVLLNLSNSN